VDAILDWRWTWLAARIALSSAYLLGGFTKLLNFRAAIAEQAHFGFHPAWLWASLAIAVELIGSMLLIAGRFVWLAAGAMGVLTFIASLAANDFWAMQGQARFLATNAFFEHIGLIAGFLLAALIAEHAQREQSSRPFSPR
jgi:uncharacterized membrane protein YphA (DoxX/SURF4 family)